VNAINACVTGDWTNAGFEAEASRTLAQKLGKVTDKYKFLVPYEVQERQHDMTAARELRKALNLRDLSVASGGGAYLVQTSNVGFVEMLYNRSVVRRLGATTLPGLVGNVAIPRMSATGTAYWLSSETATITESAQTIVQASLSPKNVGAYTEISRQLLMQSSPAAEGIVSDDLASLVAVAGDYACLAGAGSSGEPDGIIGFSGVGSVTGTSLGYDSTNSVLDFQSDVAESNVIPTRGGYVTTPAVAKLLMKRLSFTGVASPPVWTGNLWDGTVAGFPAMSSMQVPTADMIFGDWPNMVIGEWGVLEIEVNPYAGFTAGIIGVRALYSMDVAHRRPFAFSIATSIT
jgi:HK97 family phage major capsid protein